MKNYRGLELVLAGIVAGAILIGFSLFLPKTACIANLAMSYSIFLIIMQIITTATICFGVYLLSKSMLAHKHKRHK